MRIPTVPTKIQALFEKLANLDFKQATDQLNSVLPDVDSSLGELKVAEINQGTDEPAEFHEPTRPGPPDLTNSLAPSVSRTGRIPPLV